ncbi:DsbA family protein [Gynurincola endophyticus]|uniref:DsbA family protein n=1 Tax=Gynurincola endophyticus TaxID=2479004 RepID=UPI000F8EFB18|nr:DsbA family protein [Gynurincola endophyticus]
MNKIIYCYDAYCGWCYGFSKVIRKIAHEYKKELQFEVLSGGMILPETPRHITAMATVIKENYKRVEELTGVTFGEDFLWHVFNTDQSDWYPNSEKPAIALSIFKEMYPSLQVDFAADLQYALNYEGRDLCDDEAYRHLLDKYNINHQEFYEKLHSEKYKELAHYEFALCQQLQVKGYPAVFFQAGEQKFYMIGSGFTPYETLKERIELVKKEIQKD